MQIRPELPTDAGAIRQLLQAAFANDPMSDQQEYHLVEKLRLDAAYIPDLALVAEEEARIVGFILLTKIDIVSAAQSWSALALAPVAILPDHQGQGVGGKLILEAHRRAAEQGHQRIVLLGHATYYPRFGYVRCDQYGVKLPFEVPPEYCMCIGLRAGAWEGISGTVRYSAPFGMDSA